MTESEIRQAAQTARRASDTPFRPGKKEGALTWEGQVEWKWPAQPELLARLEKVLKNVEAWQPEPPIYFGPAGKWASVDGKGLSASQEPSKWVESHPEWGDAS